MKQKTAMSNKKLHPFIQELQKEFSKNADAKPAAGAKAYMLHQFDYYGMKAPVWRSIAKKYFKQQLPPFKDCAQIIRQCWQQPQREMQYTAIELLAQYKKEWTKEIIELIELMLINKSWWDSVDHIATELTGPYFIIFPQQIKTVAGRWNKSDNIWLQRSSIMFQKRYKKDTDTKLLEKYILNCAASKEFFVQKAIGWALREYSKTNAAWVKKFVSRHELAPLSKREALKRVE